MQRRDFLKTMGATVVSASVIGQAASAMSTSSKRPVRLGAPIFPRPNDPEEIALAHRAVGYRAAYCPPFSLDDKDRIRDIRAAFKKHDVVIAEVGVWCNLMDANEDARKKNLERVTEGLARAEAVGARCCVNIAGSYSKETWFGPHPKNLSDEFFDAAVENARKIIDAVNPKESKFAYEMMGWAIPDCVDSYLKLVKAIDRPGFGVHLDPCNAVNSPEKYYDNAGLINDSFDRLGPHIVSCHAKDLTWDIEMNVHFREVVLGQGDIDYRTYLTRLATLPGDVPLMIEHMKGKEEYDASREYVFKVGKEVGVAFE